MSDKNLICITGTLGRNAEQKQSKAGLSYWEMSVANSQGKDQTQWYKVIVFGTGRMDTLGPMITKGARVGVHGKLKLEAYNGKNGPTVNASIITSVDGVDLFYAKREDNGQPQQRSQSQFPFGAADDIDDGNPF